MWALPTNPASACLPARPPAARAGLGQNTLLLYNSILALPLMAAQLFLGTNEIAVGGRAV